MQEKYTRYILEFLCPALFFLEFSEYVTGEHYNLTGSSQAAVLGQSFTWTCGMFLPTGETVNGVVFYRNNTKVVTIGMNQGDCVKTDTNPRYTFQCLSATEYTLTIPTEAMTEFEENSVWRCEYFSDGRYRSPDVILRYAIDVHNISLSPGDNPLSVQESRQFVVRCVVNSNAFPEPTITWILGSTDITNTAGSDQTTINLTRNRLDNRKKLECRATNNKRPLKIASTTLNIIYKPEIAIKPSSLYKIREGQTAVMSCQVTDANPLTSITWNWTKTGNPTELHNGENFTISNIQREQSGTYQCTATNSIGISEPATVQVDVQYKPHISIATSNPYRITEGQTASLLCVLTSANPNTITEWRWTKANQPNTFLYRGPNYTIPNIQRGQSGIYRCTATNSIGTSEPATVQVDVQYTPLVSITTSNPYRITEGLTATLKCVLTAANPNIITEWKWIKTDQPNTVLYSRPNYTIPIIQRRQSGTYRCTATNIIGTSEPATIEVDVQYKPQVNITTSNPYRITEGLTATLKCVLTAANPNTITEWKWIKTEQPNTVLYSRPNYTIPNIQRRQSGTYRCIATNIIGTSKPATIVVDVQYGPAKVTLFPDVKVINKTENETLTPITCSAVCNPACSFTWTRVGMSTVNSRTLNLEQLTRTERGNYTCTAINSINSNSTIVSIIVNYPPKIKIFQTSNGQTFEEASSFNITCIVDSYPFSDIDIKKVETGEVKASGGPLESLTYRESSAKCYQTATYSCEGKNVYGFTSSNIQRITILCKPRPSDGKSDIKVGIKTEEGLNISTNFIGYPLPQISWTFKTNLTDDPRSVLGTYSVPLNVSTIKAGLMKETLNQEEFGYYIVTATTPGKTSQISTVTYHVIPQRKPNPPYNISVNCKVSRRTALVNWKPGFDGGAAQTFVVSYTTRDGFQKNSTEQYLYPNATLINLEDDTEYKIKIIATNSHGETLSEEEKSCKTIEYIEESSNIPMIVGGAVGGLVFAGLVILGIVFIFRRMNESEGKKNDQRKNILNEERETDEDDGLKENILYVSAGPTNNEKPGVSGTAVYAEVKKEGPASDSNANVYAEVQKSGKTANNKRTLYSEKGIFKKEEKPKQKKDKKLKKKKENSDVYENAEDIAMTQNLENVYSNAAESNGTKSENRGYKNQDGLLYVEVQFEQKQKYEKPVIHGEDEKTDYATVEFPFPSSSNSDKPQDGK